MHKHAFHQTGNQSIRGDVVVDGTADLETGDSEGFFALHKEAVTHADLLCFSGHIGRIGSIRVLFFLFFKKNKNPLGPRLHRIKSGRVASSSIQLSSGIQLLPNNT